MKEKRDSAKEKAAEKTESSKPEKSKKTKEKKAKEKKKMKKTTKTIIAAVIVVAALVGILVAVKFMPEVSDGDDDSSSSEIIEEYTLVNHVPADIDKIEVENESGTFTILSYTPTVETTDEDGNVSESTEATEYTLVGYEDMELMTGAPDAIASDASSIVSTQKVNDGSNKKDFGLENPRATVKTTFKSGEVATVYVGNDASADLGTYIMADGYTDIYIVESDAVDSFLYTAMDIISTDIGSAADTEENAVFSKMVFGGRLFGGDVVLEQSPYEAYSESYVITAPDSTIANEETVSYMVNAVRSLSADKVIYIGADDEKLKEYGLDDPYATVDAEYPDVKVSYKASEPDDDGNVYLLNDGIIYQLSKDALPWVTTTYDQMLPSTVLSPKLSGVSKITVDTGDKKYEFSVSRETTTAHSSDSDTDIETTETTIKYGDKTLDEGSFNIFYQNLTSAKRAGSGEIPSDRKAVLTVTYEFTDSTTASAVYYEAENRKCPVLINGTIESTAYESYVTAILSDVEKVANGETISSIT